MRRLQVRMPFSIGDDGWLFFSVTAVLDVDFRNKANLVLKKLKQVNCPQMGDAFDSLLSLSLAVHQLQALNFAESS